MDAERKEQIRKRAEAATPEPWITVRDGVMSDAYKPLDCTICLSPSGDIDQLDADLQFIAHARQDIPDLLAALDAAEQRAEKLESDVQAFQHAHGIMREKRAETEQRAEKAEADKRTLEWEFMKYEKLYTQAVAHLRVLLIPEWVDKSGEETWRACPWCKNFMDQLHKPDCPRQAAEKYLEEQESK